MMVREEKADSDGKNRRRNDMFMVWVPNNFLVMVQLTR